MASANRTNAPFACKSGHAASAPARKDRPASRMTSAEFAPCWTPRPSHVGHHPSGGYTRGREIWQLEQWMHLDIEPSLQRPLLHHEWAMRSANYYYAYAHWLSVDVVLAWLWWRHRDRYLATRATLVVFTGSCLLLHLVSTAPPRLLPQRCLGSLSPGRERRS